MFTQILILLLFPPRIHSNDDIESMICHEESWTVLPEMCVMSKCSKDCDAYDICSLCKQCMTNNQRYELHMAYREAKNRGSMKRVFPPPMVKF
jgi:hypothetical protein